MPISFRRSVKIAPGVRYTVTNKRMGNCLLLPFTLAWELIKFIFKLYMLLWNGLVWLWKRATATPGRKKITYAILAVMLSLFLLSYALETLGIITPTQP